LNILAYANDIVLFGKNGREVRQLLVEMENVARTLTTDKSRKNKIYDIGQEKHFKTK
jgi:hypothetical protein